MLTTVLFPQKKMGRNCEKTKCKKREGRKLIERNEHIQRVKLISNPSH